MYIHIQIDESDSETMERSMLLSTHQMRQTILSQYTNHQTIAHMVREHNRHGTRIYEKSVIKELAKAVKEKPTERDMMIALLEEHYKGNQVSLTVRDIREAYEKTCSLISLFCSVQFNVEDFQWGSLSKGQQIIYELIIEDIVHIVFGRRGAGIPLCRTQKSWALVLIPPIIIKNQNRRGIFVSAIVFNEYLAKF